MAKRRENPIDRVRKLAEEAGVPFKEKKPSGQRTLIFMGRRKKG